MISVINDTIFSTEINFLGKKLKSPLLGASGTVGFIYDFKEKNPNSINHLGGLCFKTLTPNKSEGNPDPWYYDLKGGGVINSNGLKNPGIDDFIKDIYPKITPDHEVTIISLAARTIEDFVQLIKKVNNLEKIDFIELNVSCPNVDDDINGYYHYKEFASNKESLRNLVIACKKVAIKPLIVKLSPNVTSISELSLVCQEAGANALTIGNTFKGMAIDIDKQIPVIAKVVGGLSGPAIKPLMLAKVYEASQVVSIPIIGVGGVMSGDDVIEYLLAGATLVGLGTVLWRYPELSKKIFEEMKKYLEKKNTKVEDLIGKLQADYHLK